MNDQKAPAELHPYTFDRWWRMTGRFYDPDTDDVPWFDKRQALADFAWDQCIALSPDLRAQLFEAKSKITNLEVDLANLREEKMFTTCMDCGERWEHSDFETGILRCVAHRTICTAHPMRALEAEILELRSEAKR